jgi:hypothetical protein
MDFQEELEQRVKHAKGRSEAALEQGRRLHRDGIAGWDELAECAREASDTLTRHQVPADETIWHSRIKNSFWRRSYTDEGYAEPAGWKLKGFDHIEMVLTLDGRLEQIYRDSDSNRETGRVDYIERQRMDLETWLGELERGADQEMCIQRLRRASETVVSQKGGVRSLKDVILDDVASLLSLL